MQHDLSHRRRYVRRQERLRPRQDGCSCQLQPLGVVERDESRPLAGEPHTKLEIAGLPAIRESKGGTALEQVASLPTLGREAGDG